MRGTVPAAADPAGNKPHAVSSFLVSQCNERRQGANKSTNTHKQTGTHKHIALRL